MERKTARHNMDKLKAEIDSTSPSRPAPLHHAGTAALLAASLLPLTACANFFVKPATTTTTTTGSSATTAGDYAYVANSSAGSTSLSEYNLSAGSLTSLGNITLGYIPVALAIAPSNNFLYAASAPGSSSPGIFLYSIDSGGALAVANSGNVLQPDTVAAMALSPDGNWLFTVNSTGITMNEYAVNTSTGALTLSSTITLPGTGCLLSPTTTTAPASQSCSVAVAPSGGYVVASLGTAGDAVLTYSSALGITGNRFNVIASGFSAGNATGDFSVVLDPNNYAYIARTGTVAVYGIGSTVVSEGSVSYAAGSIPRGITLNKSSNYVFTANEGTGTISSFAITGNGALSNGLSVAGPAHVSALAVDNTGLYLIAVGYDASEGVQLFALSSTGVLTAKAVAASDTNTALPALVAVTH